MKTEIKHQWFYESSVEEVWKYLTTAELIAAWLMPNDFQLTLGHEFKFTTNPIPSLDLSGNFYCKVLEIIPLKRLVYSWKGGSSDGEIKLDTIVEWTLQAKDNGTELRLFHHGFNEANASILASMTKGWDDHINTMFTTINTTQNGNS